MQRPASCMRCKLRVAVQESIVALKQKDFLSTHQFVVFASVYETVRDLRRIILNTFAKLYPADRVPKLAFLKDAMGYDLDDDFVVGETFESNDLVLAVNSEESGIITPSSHPFTPAQVEIVCPTPKMQKMDVEGLLQKEREQEEKDEEEESSSSEYSSTEESSEEESVEEMTVVPVPVEIVVQPSPVSSVESVDNKIAAVFAQAESASEEEEEESGSESESEEEKSESSSSSEESSEESEASELEVPAASSTEESEESSEGEEEIKVAVIETKPVALPDADSTESESSKSESESESEEDSSEEEEEEAIPQKVTQAPSDSSSSGSESDDEDLPIIGDDVKQVLKSVPKFTSLTSLNECLSQAVSGRATPLHPAGKASQVLAPETKGRVRLPRKKPGTTGYDASLFA